MKVFAVIAVLVALIAMGYVAEAMIGSPAFRMPRRRANDAETYANGDVDDSDVDNYDDEFPDVPANWTDRLRARRNAITSLDADLDRFRRSRIRDAAPLP
ncbi:RxLR effector protein [Plasmodiophora brassicae]|uniref:RxLR effector protein n=1 Tax=Plasmodiophora brassicae TaxID=37360 RepID=A0A0G4J7D8_PLABS|nr:hypothetical protein PBRA_002922 [Plasmodiophora brassicae]